MALDGSNGAGAGRGVATPGAPAAALPTFGLATVGIFLAYASSFTTPWNGASVLGLRPGDLLALMSLMAFGLADLGQRFPRLPGWAWTFGATIMLVTVLHEVLPIDPHYLEGRTLIDASGQPSFEIASNLSVGAKFLVPIIGLPLMYGFCALHLRASLVRSAIAYALGSAVSALVGFSDSLGLTTIGQSVTGVPVDSTGRAAGFTVHPNFLAATCVISTAFALWLLTQRTAARIGAAIVLVPLLLGIYSSGSRGGAAVFVLALMLSVIVLPEFRRHLSSIALFAGIAVAILFVASPSLGASLLSAVRLQNGGESVTGSDAVRSIVREQGLADVKESPVYGVGMQVAAEAHNVYLQALASGGVLLFTGFVIFLLGAITSSVRLIRIEPFARALVIASISSAVLSSVENSLVDRLVYVPMALIAAVPNMFRRTDVDAAPAADVLLPAERALQR